MTIKLIVINDNHRLLFKNSKLFYKKSLFKFIGMSEVIAMMGSD